MNVDPDARARRVGLEALDGVRLATDGAASEPVLPTTTWIELARVGGVDAAGHGDAELGHAVGSVATVRQVFVAGLYSCDRADGRGRGRRAGVAADRVDARPLAGPHRRRAERVARREADRAPRDAACSCAG